jgi:hypothetical protein
MSMKHGTALLIVLILAAGCTEPEHARGREPAEALQVDPAQRSFLEDAPSYRVAEAIRSSALEVRPERALFLAAVMDPERAEAEEETRRDVPVASHHAFPFNVLVRLTHGDTGARTHVRMLDPGPFIVTPEPLEPDPVIAVSPTAARELGVGVGKRAHVWVEIVEW